MWDILHLTSLLQCSNFCLKLHTLIRTHKHSFIHTHTQTRRSISNARKSYLFFLSKYITFQKPKKKNIELASICAVCMYLCVCVCKRVWVHFRLAYVRFGWSVLYIINSDIYLYSPPGIIVCTIHLNCNFFAFFLAFYTIFETFLYITLTIKCNVCTVCVCVYANGGSDFNKIIQNIILNTHNNHHYHHSFEYIISNKPTDNTF